MATEAIFPGIGSMTWPIEGNVIFWTPVGGRRLATFSLRPRQTWPRPGVRDVSFVVCMPAALSTVRERAYDNRRCIG